MVVADENHTIFGHTISVIISAYYIIKIFNSMILAVIFVCQYFWSYDFLLV